MPKKIIAEKRSDGWSVQIIDTRYLLTESDVLTLIRQEGLTVDEEIRQQTGTMIIGR